MHDFLVSSLPALEVRQMGWSLVGEGPTWLHTLFQLHSSNCILYSEGNFQASTASIAGNYENFAKPQCKRRTLARVRDIQKTRRAFWEMQKILDIMQMPLF